MSELAHAPPGWGDYPYPRGRRIDLGGGAWVTVCGEGPNGISNEALAELSDFAAYLREMGEVEKPDRPDFKAWRKERGNGS